ncbi:uracil-DNA glycosylase [bacterium]|nr:uracil-DNA glycosylase [bacterium]
MTTWQDFFATQDIPHIRNWIAYTRSLGVAVYPPDQDVFRAFDLTPLQDVRVVILGQDPYFNGEADGLAFSAGRAKRLPLSLQRIVAEVKDDGFEVASTWRGSLDAWAKQGVLLLNTALTVQHGTPEIYMPQWSRFTAACLRFLIENRSPHFILWGSVAMQTFRDVADSFWINADRDFPWTELDPNAKVPTATYSAHPAARNATPNPLKGSRPFSKANEVLRWRRRGDVDWSLR